MRPRGHSMAGKVGDTVTVEPVGERELRADEVVLCKVRGREYLHLVKAEQNRHYPISNNRGVANGWIGCVSSRHAEAREPGATPQT